MNKDPHGWLVKFGVTRIVAPNPSLLTGEGTNTWIIHDRQGASVVDPGPAIERHVRNIVEHCPEGIVKIFVTHTHADHSPASRILKELTGAQIVGLPLVPVDSRSFAQSVSGLNRAAEAEAEMTNRSSMRSEHHDLEFIADSVPIDGQVFKLSDRHDLMAVLTPGHAANHVCWKLSSIKTKTQKKPLKILFTGDHILGGSYVVIPPDGDMDDYLASLAKLAKLDLQFLAPGHGEILDNPDVVIADYITHRRSREQSIIDLINQRGPLSAIQITKAIYPSSVEDIAIWNVCAHLKSLVRQQRCVVTSTSENLGSKYSIVR